MNLTFLCYTDFFAGERQNKGCDISMSWKHSSPSKQHYIQVFLLSVFFNAVFIVAELEFDQDNETFKHLKKLKLETLCSF